MYNPERGLFEQATPDQRANIVSDLCGLIEDMACAIEDVHDSARSFEKELNQLLYGNSRENPFNRFDRRW